MIFGAVPVGDAEGTLLAHSVSAGARRLRKAHRLTAEDIALLRAEGIGEVIVARLEPGDLVEDEAAARIAAALRVAGVEIKPAATGRVNIHAEDAGLFTVSPSVIGRINDIDPRITLATLENHAAVEPGRMVATVKIIPFAVPGAIVEAAEAIAGEDGAFQVHPFRSLRVGVVQTVLPSIKPSVLDKTVGITAERLQRSGSSIVAERRVPHEAGAVSGAIAELLEGSDLVAVFGASAMSDPADVIPAAIEQAGGEVERVGMPVDPGNLLVLGEVAGKPVLGAPGCARSPKPNGFDFVLDRLLAGIDVSSADIAAMGVGGLLMEIPSRPQPREGRAPKRAEAGILLLAAGRSSRMGGPNKLLASFDGEPLICRVARRAVAAKAARTIAVLGHQAADMAPLIAGTGIETVENRDYAHGLSTSLKAGIAALGDRVDGALVMLADMPGIETADLEKMIAAFRRAGGTAVIRATHNGKRGNPVILPRALFEAAMHLEGDTGARHLVEQGELDVVEVELGEAASVDVDTPDALRRAGGVLT